MDTFKRYLPVLFLFVLSYWSIKPFFSSGFFPIHDDTQVARVFEMNHSLRDGMIPVRWVSDLGYGYGYPIFNFYAPLAYYVGGFFTFVFDALTATKIVMAIAILASGIFMYLFAREFWGEEGGLLSGLLYIYAPYHAVDIFVRGDVAEIWAYAFIPIAFLSIYKIYLILRDQLVSGKQNVKFQLKLKNSAWLWILIGSIGYAAIILSHNLSAMMVTPFFFIFTVILYIASRIQEPINKPYFVFFPILIGILLAGFYFLPALLEMSYTNVISQVGGGADYHNHFVCLNQLWSSPWGYGGSVPGCMDGLSFKIGKLHLLLSLFSLWAIAFFWNKNKIKSVLLITFSFFFLLSAFFMLEQSVFVWDAIPQMAFIQYPWRFLIFASFFTSILSGSSVLVVYTLFQKFKVLRIKGLEWIITFVFIFASLFLNAKVFIPQAVLNKTSADYTNLLTLKWTTSRISDEYMPKGFYKPLSQKDIPAEKIFYDQRIVSVSDVSEKTQNLSASIFAKHMSEMLINTAYFPGWHVMIDGKLTSFKYFNKGLLVNIPEGSHVLTVVFTQTTIEKLGNLLSLTGVCILVLGIILQRKEEYERKKTAS